MCGFIGIHDRRGLGRPPVQEMLRRIAHRGPDERTHYRDSRGKLEVGFARLSIIDLETGSQPVSNENGEIAAWVNGEIYNYVELSRDLRTRGHKFRSQGDAETVVHLYEEFGDQFLLKLEGMFSIALWDKKRERLLLARDSFGIKPLYYSIGPGPLVFGSEIKALLGFPSVGREPDPQAISEFLSYQYVPAPRTFFRDIRKLPPGHKLVASDGGVMVERFSDFAEVPSVSGSPEEIGERVLALFDESVRLHLRSDVPVGAFLSGGIDSGLLVARASRLSSRLNTYTLSFAGGNDESPLAEELSRRCGTRHRTHRVEAASMFQLLPKILWACDEPVADSGFIPNQIISNFAAADGVKVVLSGAGGDELFAGYPHYFPKARELPFIRHAWLGAAASAAARLVAPGVSEKIDRALSSTQDPWAHYLGHTTLWTRRERMALMGEAFPNGPEHGARLEDLKRSTHDPLNTKLYADLRSYLPEDILFVSDRTTMIHSIEGRVPFLYRPLATLALGIPGHIKAPGNARKWLLRKIAAPFLPESYLAQKKFGFNSPIDSWLTGEMRQIAMTQLSGERSMSRPWWNRRGLSRFLKSGHRSGPAKERLFTLWILELFCRIHLDGGGEKPAGLELGDL